MASDILLFSGGVDSFVAYYFLGRPQTVYFDLHSRYSDMEKKVVRKLIPETIIDSSLQIGAYETGEDAYIPFRNLSMALQASRYGNRIWIAGLRDDLVVDKSPEAFHSMTRCMNAVEKNPDYLVDSPFWRMTKPQVVRWYLDNIDPSGMDLFKTASCYSGNKGTYCGGCKSCFRKWVAFRENGLKLEFYNIPMLQEYLSRARGGHYITLRNRSIIKVVEPYLVGKTE